MSRVLDRYRALSDTSSGDNASATLTAILAALVTKQQLDAKSRKTLAQLILDDLKSALLSGAVSRIPRADAPQAFRILKGLGSTTEVAETLSLSSNLSALLRLSTKIDDALPNDALRCIANTLLLDESSRVTFIGPEVDGGSVCIDLLHKSSTEHVFLAFRILFFCTAALSSAAPFIRWLVEYEESTGSGSVTAIDVIGAKLDDLVELVKRGDALAKDAIPESLKLIFNLCCHYPKIVDCDIQSPEVASSDSDDKVMGDCWSSRLDSLLLPLLRAFHVSLPSGNPLESPLPHVIHALIIFPVISTNRDLWFGKQSSEKTLLDSPGFPPPRDSARHAYELLDATLAYFMPGNINSDDPSIRRRLPDEETLDDLVSPLIILITRFCLGDEDAKVRLRSWFIPPDLDRSEPLEMQSHLLGRCLRLLQSVYHDRLNKVCGEMLFAMCDSDSATLSGYVGYGNVAGFLFHKGVVSTPLRSSASAGAPMTTATGLPIDPITGTIAKERDSAWMSEEEKEQEAEKLFVLFDRLERTGAILPSQNPLRKAIQEGKLG